MLDPLRSLPVAAAAVGLLAACGGPQRTEEAQAPNAADALFTMLQGAFDSADQAAVDEDYYDISLVMCAADAPTLGQRVLYVEQAVAATPEAPYRQRAYVVESGDRSHVATTDVYEFTEPERWVGACDGTPSFTADDVSLRDGCGVTMHWEDGAFTGGTDPRSCPSTLRGASYATSEVVLTPERLESWDRGYDADGTQVWGAEAGAYVFERR